MPPPIPATVTLKLRLQPPAAGEQDFSSCSHRFGSQFNLSLLQAVYLSSSFPVVSSSACRKLEGSIRAPLSNPWASSAVPTKALSGIGSSPAGAAFLRSSHLPTERSQSQCQTQAQIPQFRNPPGKPRFRTSANFLSLIWGENLS